MILKHPCTEKKNCPFYSWVQQGRKWDQKSMTSWVQSIFLCQTNMQQMWRNHQKVGRNSTWRLCFKWNIVTAQKCCHGSYHHHHHLRVVLMVNTSLLLWRNPSLESFVFQGVCRTCHAWRCGLVRDKCG